MRLYSHQSVERGGLQQCSSGMLFISNIFRQGMEKDDTIVQHILPYLAWNGCASIGEQTRLSVLNSGIKI